MLLSFSTSQQRIGLEILLGNCNPDIVYSFLVMPEKGARIMPQQSPESINFKDAVESDSQSPQVTEERTVPPYMGWRIARVLLTGLIGAFVGVSIFIGFIILLGILLPGNGNIEGSVFMFLILAPIVAAPSGFIVGCLTGIISDHNRYRRAIKRT
jgi:hypothetical protein